MTFQFDELIRRENTNSYKWDKYSGDVIPLWVADMDFTGAPAIREALHQLAEFNVIGYSRTPDELVDVICQRLQDKHHWEIQPEWIVWLPGMIPGLHAASLSLGNVQAGVMTSTPVYRPFLDAATRPNRHLIDVPFQWKNARWEMDFEQMEAKITPDTRLYMLCNPHNPNGRMFDADELGKLADFCIKHDLWICSDEIHCDIIMDANKKHLSIASLSPAIADRTITLLAPSKAFNIAGLGCSFAVIPNAEIRKKFTDSTFGLLPMPNAFAQQAALAAYQDSAEWLEEVLTYLRGNHAYILEEINKIEGLRMTPLEGTYLAWIDFSALQKPDFVSHLEKFGVGVQDASIFGGSNYFRLNFATQRTRLQEAMKRIQLAVNSL